MSAKRHSLDVNCDHIEQYDDGSDDEDMLICDLATISIPSRPKSTMKKMDAYSTYMKEYQEVCNLVKTPNEDVTALFEECFANLTMKILQYNSSSQDNVGTASFPNITKVPYLKRKKPSGSPRK